MPTKVHKMKAMVFPVVRYARERWTIKEAEHRRTDAFQLWCWRRLLRASWTARRSNESILKEITLNIHWKDWCWSWCSSTLATWWQEPTHWKRLMLGRTEGRRRRGWQRTRWLMASLTQWTWVGTSSGSYWRTGKPAVLQSMGSQRVRHDWATKQQPPCEEHCQCCYLSKNSHSGIIYVGIDPTVLFASYLVNIRRTEI